MELLIGVTKPKNLDLFKKVNDAGKVCVLSPEMNLFFSECFFRPKLPAFFSEIGNNPMRALGRAKRFFLCNARPKSNA